MKVAAELGFGNEPDVVPRARKLVCSSLGDLPEDQVADAELVVSELVTNAALHGEPPIVVRVKRDSCIRVEVEDSGHHGPLILRQDTQSMTGRGLSLVGALASSWGVEAVPGGGKMVWAELYDRAARDLRARAQSPDLDALLAAWPEEEPLPSTFTVRLGPVSTELLLAAKSHIDNVVRELILLRQGEEAGGAKVPAPMAELIQAVTSDFAEVRAELKRQAAAAAARGDPVTDVVLHLAPDAAEAGERYLEALDWADRYARSADLLTLAPPPEHRVFRQWYVRALTGQLRALSRGEQPPSPQPLQLALAEEVSRLAARAADSTRLLVLQRVTRDLAGADGADDMARIVVDQAVEYPGVETAGVRLLTPDGRLRTAAWRGRSGGHPVDRSGDVALDSDLPAAVAVRSGRSMYLPAGPRALAHYPDLAYHLPPDQSGHLVSLKAGGQIVGVLTLTFAGGETTGETEAALVESLGGALSQALGRLSSGHDGDAEPSVDDLHPRQ